MTDQVSAGGNERHVLIFHAMCLLPYHIPAIYTRQHPRYDGGEAENGDDGVGGVVEMERTTSRRRRVAAVGHAKLCARYHAFLYLRIQ